MSKRFFILAAAAFLLLTNVRAQSDPFYPYARDAEKIVKHNQVIIKAGFGNNTTCVGGTIRIQYGTTADYGSVLDNQQLSSTPWYDYFTLANLQPNTTYHYRVGAKQMSATCPPNDYIYTQDYTFTTTEIPTAPSVPANVTITAASPTSYTLSWSASTGTVTSYYLRHRTDQPFTDANYISASYERSTPSFTTTVDGLVTNTRYYVGVRACNTTDYCSSVVPVSVVLGSLAPAAPTAFTVTETTATSLAFSWTGAAHHYAVKLRTSGVFASWDETADITVNDIAVNTLAALPSPLTSGTKYYAAIRACTAENDCSAITQTEGTTTVTARADGLLGHWKFDGNGANDVAGNPAALALGNATFKTDGGKLGGYLYIPSSSDSAKIPYSSAFDLPTSFTVEFWFRQRADRPFLQDLVYKGTPQNNYNFRIFRQLWNQYNFGPIITGYTAVGTGYWSQTSNTNQLAHNAWHHVAYTKDANGSAYYLDGALIHSLDTRQYTEYAGAARTPASDIIIGDSAVDTDIDNLRIYNRGFSIDEVKSNGGFPIAPPPSTLSGSILENRTLSLAQSPYTVTGNVTVFPGATLTVEPGVTMKFDQSTGLTVRGALVADGTTGAPIIFTSSLAAPIKGMWNGITIDTTQGGKASIKFATVAYATTGFSVMCCHSGGPVTITDSTFRENLTALGGYGGSVTVVVDRTTFENNSQAVTSADKKITNSTFKNNTYGLYQTERISVTNSTFTGHKVALWGGRGEVTQSTITGNETGVQSFFEGFTLKYNTITGNGVGVILGEYGTSSGPVQYNNIYDNTTQNLKATGTANKTVTGNWWGTTDTATIDAKIFDGRDDSVSGLVTYKPYATHLVMIVTMTPPSLSTDTTDTTTQPPVTSPSSNVSGSIFSATTWSKSQSPYTVTGNVTVFPGATLTVEPGVTVKFDQSTGLTVRGALVAVGAAATPITFTSSLAAPVKGMWNGITIDTTQGGKASLAFATVSYATTGFSVMCCHSGGPVTITDSTFRENLTALGGYGGSVTVVVDRTTFENNSQAVTSADKKITNSTFKNNTYGLYQTERISVTNSTFTGHKVALWGGRGTITQSTITGNETGVQAFFEGFTLKHNTITGNGVGVLVGQYGTSSSPVTYNNLHSNTLYNLKASGTVSQTATNNWWGTTDTATIDAKIFDGRDDSALGLVTYQPMATAAIDITNPTPMVIIPPIVVPPIIPPAATSTPPSIVPPIINIPPAATSTPQVIVPPFVIAPPVTVPWNTATSTPPFVHLPAPIATSLPDVTQKICPQIYAPVCGRDGHTYPNHCAAEGVTAIAWEGRCDQPPLPPQGSEERFSHAKSFLGALQERQASLEQLDRSIADAEGKQLIIKLKGDVGAQMFPVQDAIAAQDVGRITALTANTEQALRAIDEQIKNIAARYRSDRIRDEAERNRNLAREYTTAVRGEDAGFFGDDPAYLRVKIETKKLLLQRAEDALTRGDKRLADRLFNEAQATLGSEARSYTTPTNVAGVDATDLSRILEDIRNGLTASWEGVDRLRKETIEPDAGLIIALQKGESLYQDARGALQAGSNEEVNRLLTALKSLGLHEKFGNFRGGTGRAVMPRDRVNAFFQELRSKQEQLRRGVEEFASRGADTSAIEPLRGRLATLLEKAKSTTAGGDEKLLVQLMDELRSMNIEGTLSQIFQTLGSQDFLAEINEPLADAPQYIVAMQKVIDGLSAKGVDVSSLQTILQTTETARSRAQSLVDSGQMREAEAAVRGMFASGTTLYNLLGGDNVVARYLPKQERAAVRNALTVDVRNLANVEALGTTAVNDVDRLVVKSGVSAAEKVALASTLSQVSSDVLQKMLDARKRYGSEIQSLLNRVPDLPSDVRTAMFTKKVEMLGELDNFDDARRTASKVKGITRAALQQMDALKARLAQFNFPPVTGDLIVQRVETFVDTVRSGALADAVELQAYVGTFQKEIASYVLQAGDEKYKSGITPAKNIDDASPLYAPAMVLKTEGALQTLVTKKGDVALAATIDGATYEKFLEAAVQENAIRGSNRQKLKRVKAVRGADAVRYLLIAYHIDAPKATLQNLPRLRAYLKKEFNVAFTQKDLASPLTRSNAITLVGTVEEKVGSRAAETP